MRSTTRGVEQTFRLAHSPCVVDQDVESPELFGCVCDKARAEAFVRDVTGQEYGFSASRADVLRYFLSIRLLFGQIADCDIGSFTRKRDGCSASNSGVPACEQSFTSSQS